MLEKFLWFVTHIFFYNENYNDPDLDPIFPFKRTFRDLNKAVINQLPKCTCTSLVLFFLQCLNIGSFLDKFCFNKTILAQENVKTLWYFFKSLICIPDVSHTKRFPSQFYICSIPRYRIFYFKMFLEWQPCHSFVFVFYWFIVF